MFCKSYAFALASALVLTSMHRKDRHTHPHPPSRGGRRHGGFAAWTNEARRGSQCRRLNEVLTGERA